MGEGGGGTNPRDGSPIYFIWKLFAKNCMKLKDIGGGGRVVGGRGGGASLEYANGFEFGIKYQNIQRHHRNPSSIIFVFLTLKYFLSSNTNVFFFFKKIRRTSVLFVGSPIPLCWTSGGVSRGFQSNVFLFYRSCYTHLTSFSSRQARSSCVSGAGRRWVRWPRIT